MIHITQVLTVPSCRKYCYLHSRTPVLFPSPYLVLLYHQFQRASSVFRHLPTYSFPVSARFTPVFLFSVFFVSDAVFVRFPFESSGSSPRFLYNPARTVLPRAGLPAFLSELSRQFYRPQTACFSAYMHASRSVPGYAPVPAATKSLFYSSVHLWVTLRLPQHIKINLIPYLFHRNDPHHSGTCSLICAACRVPTTTRS